MKRGAEGRRGGARRGRAAQETGTTGTKRPQGREEGALPGDRWSAWWPERGDIKPKDDKWMSSKRAAGGAKEGTTTRRCAKGTSSEDMKGVRNGGWKT